MALPWILTFFGGNNCLREVDPCLLKVNRCRAHCGSEYYYAGQPGKIQLLEWGAGGKSELDCEARNRLRRG